MLLSRMVLLGGKTHLDECNITLSEIFYYLLRT